jgi:dolichyl-phosphate beta-glucosyltransferase
VALGSRIQPDGSDMRKSQPLYRRLLGRVFHGLASVWAVGPVQDTQCGFKGFTREAAHDLFGHQKITSIVFDVELIYLARRRGYRMAVVPIVWTDKRGSRMRPRPAIAARVLWDLLRTPLVHRRVRRNAPGPA